MSLPADQLIAFCINGLAQACREAASLITTEQVNKDEREFELYSELYPEKNIRRNMVAQGTSFFGFKGDISTVDRSICKAKVLKEMLSLAADKIDGEIIQGSEEEKTNEALNRPIYNFVHS